jgi:hypothetical protein
VEVEPVMFTTRVNRNPIDRASVIVGLLLASCTMQMNQTPGGGMAVTHLELRQPGFAPMTIQPSQPATPPPSSALSSPPVMPGSLDGVYSGIASPLGAGGGRCLTDQKITDFRVSGNSVRWGGFRGTIDRSRGVQIPYGGDWLFGEFIGTQFSGVLQRTGTGSSRTMRPGCTYRLLLQRG